MSDALFISHSINELLNLILVNTSLNSYSLLLVSYLSKYE